MSQRRLTTSMATARQSGPPAALGAAERRRSAVTGGWRSAPRSRQPPVRVARMAALPGRRSSPSWPQNFDTCSGCRTPCSGTAPRPVGLAAAHGQKVLRECAHHGKPHCTPRAGSVTRRKEAVSGGLLTRGTATTRSDALGQSMGGTVKQILSPGKTPGAGRSHGRATASSRMAFPARPTRLRASSGSRPGRTTRGAGGMFSMVVRWHNSCTAPPEEGGML